MTVSPAYTGNIKINGIAYSGAYKYDVGDKITIEATGSTDYRFDKWEGALSGKINPAALTLNNTGGMEITAYFVLDTQKKETSLIVAKNLIDSEMDVLVIDVSNSSDYNNSHILCAKTFPWNSSTQIFNTNISRLDSFKEQDILLYDQTGALSGAAAEYLIQQGFGFRGATVYFMTEGLNSWIAEGFDSFSTAEDSDICSSLPPMAYAGPDQTVNENANVTLYGYGFDSEGGTVTYSWSQIQGSNNVSLSSTTAAQPNFTAPDLNGSDDALIFHLTVTDDEGDKDTDSVTVNMSWNNVEPTANAGTDQAVAYGTVVTLSGSGSTDPEDSIESYSWSATLGTINPSLSNASTVSPSFIAPSTDGWVIYKLTVTDNGGLTGTDTVKVTVSSSGGPGPSTLEKPTGLAANAVSYRKIMLRWTDGENKSFKIERKKKFCSDDTYAWTQIATVQFDDVTDAKNYGDEGDFEPGMKYSYRVRAYSGSDNSEYSDCASILYPMSSASTPSAPVNLVATYSSASADTIDLSWDQWGSTVTKFEIYRDENNSGSWTLLTTNASDVLTYSDTTARNNQTTSFYIYKVLACNAAGCSPPTYKVGVPFNPTDLSATVNAQNKIVLQWTDNSDDERGFEIYRKTGGCSSSASWKKVKQAGISRETVTAGSATSGTYSYKIRAYYRSWGIPYVYGYSDWSDCVEIVVP